MMTSDIGNAPQNFEALHLYWRNLSHRFFEGGWRYYCYVLIINSSRSYNCLKTFWSTSFDWFRCSLAHLTVFLHVLKFCSSNTSDIQFCFGVHLTLVHSIFDKVEYHRFGEKIILPNAEICMLLCISIIFILPSVISCAFRNAIHRAVEPAIMRKTKTFDRWIAE